MLAACSTMPCPLLDVRTGVVHSVGVLFDGFVAEQMCADGTYGALSASCPHTPMCTPAACHVCHVWCSTLLLQAASLRLVCSSQSSVLCGRVHVCRLANHGEFGSPRFSGSVAATVFSPFVFE
jgi:hypothetical protein